MKQDHVSLQDALNAMTEQIAILSGDGVIVATNTAWQDDSRTDQSGPHDFVGRPIGEALAVGEWCLRERHGPDPGRDRPRPPGPAARLRGRVQRGAQCRSSLVPPERDTPDPRAPGGSHHSARHHPPEGARGRPAGSRQQRCPHGALQSKLFHARGLSHARARQAARLASRTHLPRHRQIQGHQRPARPRGGRRGVGPRGSPTSSTDTRKRPACPPRRRRVRGAGEQRNVPGERADRQGLPQESRAATHHRRHAHHHPGPASVWPTTRSMASPSRPCSPSPTAPCTPRSPRGRSARSAADRER